MADPTPAQIAARLNPTASTLPNPTSGLWRAQGDNGNNGANPGEYLVYNSSTKQFSSVNPSNFKSQYGIDFNSLPAFVPSDINPGQNNSGYAYVKDITGWNIAPATNAPVTINNTPNTVATPDQLAAAKTATDQQLSADQGQNVQSQTDANGNTVSTTATPLVNAPPQTATVQPVTAQLTASVNAPVSLSNPQLPTSALQPGMTGDAVKQLQDYLVSKGYMTQAQVNTGYGTYGPQTTAAVAQLQQDLGVNNSSGVGYFGPLTLSALQQNPTVTASGDPGTGTPGTTATNTTGASGTGLTYDSNYGVTTDQWNQMNDSQRAIIAAAYTAKQTAYNTTGQQMTFADALTQAAQDPNIVAKYADAAKLDAQTFQQNIQQLQQASTTGAQNNQIQFENDRKTLADQEAAKGAAYSGFRNLAQQQLGQQESGIVQSSRATLQQNLNNATQDFATKYGTAATTPATTTFNDPFAGSNISLSGQYNPNANGATSLSGVLPGGITGSQPIAQQQDINAKAQDIYNTVNTTPTIA